MNPYAHLAVSVAIGGGVWAATGEANALPAAVGSGFLVDVDHLFDYYNWYARRDRRRMVLFLHAWELAGVAGLVYALAVREPWMLAVAISHFAHVAADQLFNHGYGHTYSLAARALLRFDAKRLHPHDRAHTYRHLLKNLPPFVRPILGRWFKSRV